MVKGFMADFLFWDAVIGRKCDDRKGSRIELIEALTEVTSLDEAEAGEVIDEMAKHGRIAWDAAEERFRHSVTL